MRTGGFIGSITVRQHATRRDYYEILAGHRRTRAARLAHLAAVPCTVVDLDDQAARWFVLQDNLQRSDFLPWEEGEGYRELVESGFEVAQVAGKAGKSPSFVAGRIKLAENLGDLARQEYLQKSYGVEVLHLLAELPDRDLCPVACPRCNKVNAEGTVTCLSCSTDLSGEFVFPSGNPQSAAARLCRGAAAAVAAEKVARVKDSYGLGEAPVQTSLGFDDLQISQDAVAVKSALERKLAEVSNLQEWVLRHLEDLQEYTPGQRAAVRAQCAAAIRVFEQVAAAVPAEQVALAM
jgi:hypothetical protein